MNQGNYTQPITPLPKMQELKKAAWIANVKRVYGWTTEQATAAHSRIFK